MSGLPILKPKELIRILREFGFEEMRQKGSHLFLQHSDGRTTIVPVHGREEIGRGLLRQILREIEISPEDFMKLL
ncbi:MAG: type II toxin-antitoxin system HicA family toxin [bacterium]|nr:type II toxin-antitoxin system HicA family toxin [bacterium]